MRSWKIESESEVKRLFGKNSKNLTRGDKIQMKVPYLTSWTKDPDIAKVFANPRMDPFTKQDISDDELRDMGFKTNQTFKIVVKTYAVLPTSKLIADIDNIQNAQIDHDENEVIVDSGSIDVVITEVKEYKVPKKEEVKKGHVLINGVQYPVTNIPTHIQEVPWLNLSNMKLKSLPYIPKVKDTLNLTTNQLISLQGCPVSVKNFNCAENLLTSLEGGPRLVSESYDCSSNHLTTLKGAPQSKIEQFDCNTNKLKNLIGSPRIVGTFICSNNNLQSLDGAPDEVETFYCYDNPKKFTEQEIRNQIRVTGSVYID